MVVLSGVKALKFWDSKYQSFLPGSPAAVPKIKDILASAAFREERTPMDCHHSMYMLALISRSFALDDLDWSLAGSRGRWG